MAVHMVSLNIRQLAYQLGRTVTGRVLSLSLSSSCSLSFSQCCQLSVNCDACCQRRAVTYRSTQHLASFGAPRYAALSMHISRGVRSAVACCGGRGRLDGWMDGAHLPHHFHLHLIHPPLDTYAYNVIYQRTYPTTISSRNVFGEICFGFDDSSC